MHAQPANILIPAVTQPPPLMLWRSTLPLPTHWSSSTLPAGGHTLTCPPSGLPKSLLAVILNPCWRSSHPYPTSSHPIPLLLAVIFTPAHAESSSTPPAGVHIHPFIPTNQHKSRSESNSPRFYNFFVWQFMQFSLFCFTSLFFSFYIYT